MYYVYALKSTVNGDLYIGFCRDLKERIKRHNSKMVRSTKTNAPWILLYYEAYLNIQDATTREKKLKWHRVKEDLKLQIQKSLEI